MLVNIAYGKTYIPLNIDADVEVLNLKKQELKDEKRVLEEAFRVPFGKSLKEVAKDKKTACIVITDVTRPTPNELILPYCLAPIEEAGIKREDIIILVATGLHEPNEGDTLRAMVGSYIFENYKIVNHNARIEESLVYLGETENDSPVYINKIYHEAELKVLTGLIEPHFMAGYSGGRKCICPGIAGEKTICSMHSPKFLENENAKINSVENNPFHKEILSVAKIAGGADFIVNVLIDEDKRIVDAVCGDMEKSHLAGIEKSMKHCVCEFKEKADIVITSGAGFPLDATFYQAIKGMVCALDALKDGGTIIIASECIQGIGGKEFTEMVYSFEGYEAFLKKITEGGFLKIDQWQLEEYCKASAKANIVMYSENIGEEVLSPMGIKKADSLLSAVEDTLKEKPNAKIIAIPKGPYVVPSLSK